MHRGNDMWEPTQLLIVANERIAKLEERCCLQQSVIADKQFEFQQQSRIHELEQILKNVTAQKMKAERTLEAFEQKKSVGE